MLEFECLTSSESLSGYTEWESNVGLCPPDVDECYPHGICNPDTDECGPDYGGDCWPDSDCFPTGDDSDDKYY